MGQQRSINVLEDPQEADEEVSRAHWPQKQLVKRRLLRVLRRGGRRGEGRRGEGRGGEGGESRVGEGSVGRRSEGTGRGWRRRSRE